MSIHKYCISLIFLLFSTGVALSQEIRTEIYIDFRVNSSVIDSAYATNADRMQKIVEYLRKIREDHTVNIVEISFRGAASPEGGDRLNRRLARERLAALEQFVRMEIDIPDSLITRNDSYIPWDYLKSQVATSNLPHKEKVLAILEDDASLKDYHTSNSFVDHRILQLKALDNGKVWEQMKKRFFGCMRNACAVFVTYRQKNLPEQEHTTIAAEPVNDARELSPNTTGVVKTIAAEEKVWSRKLHVKTNAIGLGMAIANIAAEIDLAQHWSFSLPLYFCAWDYFKSTIKFRMFSTYPEVRYWLSENNEGLYAAAHIGAVGYNFAFNNAYRYQRHHRSIPDIGGGIGIGYRMPVSKNNRWKIEFSLGAGAYRLHYEKFHNTPNTKDGLIVASSKKTYWGVDQLAVSFAYTFDLKKKGGKQ